jgi:hypothetical protein
MYSEAEIKFLIQPHRVETADRGSRPLEAAADLREIGCPVRIFNRILESREKKLGSRFVEFRNSQRQLPTATPAPDLDAQIQASKLF